MKENKSTPKQILFLSIMAFTIATMCLLSCEKETTNKCKDSQEGVLRNLTGLDGCGWIIQLTDSTKLEPINLEDFNVELVENKSVCIQYVERIDLGSYCMVGKVVEIVFLE